MKYGQPIRKKPPQQATHKMPDGSTMPDSEMKKPRPQKKAAK